MTFKFDLNHVFWKNKIETEHNCTSCTLLKKNGMKQFQKKKFN